METEQDKESKEPAPVQPKLEDLVLLICHFNYLIYLCII